MKRAIFQEDFERIQAQAWQLPWHRLEGKTVLVTGANGFLPAYMVQTLLHCNERPGWKETRVLALVRDAQRAAIRFAAYRQRTDLELIVHDVTQPLRLDRPVHYVIHAASQASPKYYGTDPVGTLLPNVVGTRHLLDLARDHQVESFLFFSSGEVYGQGSEGQAAWEESCFGRIDPAEVRSCYAESKRMGETMCVCWHAQYGVPARIARPFHTYGPGMRLDDGRVFADFVASIVEDRDLCLSSDGCARRAFCYLADATAGFFTVLLAGESGQAYNVGNDRQEVSIRELADRLVAAFPEKGLKVIRQPPPPEKAYLPSKLSRNCPDIAKIRKLGWEPTTSIEEGFRRTVRSFQ